MAAASAGLRGRKAVRVFVAEMASSPLTALVVAGAMAVSPRHAWIAATPFLLAWTSAPVIAWALSQPQAPRQRVLTLHERSAVRRLARKTWHYFEVFVGPDNHWLPPDNFQEAPGRQLARRTSPTNIGMGLLSTLAARDLGFIDDRELIERIGHALDTCEALERHEGHLLNWYDTSSLAPLWPRYVSTVDSGNLVASLIALASGLESLATTRDAGPPVRQGLADTAAVVRGFASGIWFALDGTHYEGGQTTMNGIASNDLQSNSRFGMTMSFPINRRQSLKFGSSSGVATRTGTDFDLYALAWQYRWGGGI